MAAAWKLTGTYFESCNCEAACPCVFLSPPTTGECTVLIGWHIEAGTYEEVSLDGLNVALAIHSPGHMLQVKWKAALYLDEQAGQEQQRSLTTIFAGQAGGHPAMLAQHIGEVVGVKSVPIEYRADGKSRSLRIPDIAEMEIEAIAGQGGAEVTISNHPLCVAPGQAAVVAKSKRLHYNDPGLQWGLPWELTGKNGFFSPFSYQATQEGQHKKGKLRGGGGSCR